METENASIPVFEFGDAIRVMVEAEDEAGVARVEARFRLDKPNSVNSVLRSAELSGETSIKEYLEFEIDKDFIPGNYVCEYVSLTDKLGNKSLFAAPGIEFTVEGEAADREGPELKRLALA